MSFSDNRNMAILASAGLLTAGLIVGGYLLGDGLLRAREADRSVTVRGLAEKDVTADLATWTIAYSANGFDLQSVGSDIDQNTQQLKEYFTQLGFKPEDIREVTVYEAATGTSCPSCKGKGYKGRPAGGAAGPRARDAPFIFPPPLLRGLVNDGRVK